MSGRSENMTLVIERVGPRVEERVVGDFLKEGLNGRNSIGGNRGHVECFKYRSRGGFSSTL